MIKTTTILMNEWGNYSNPRCKIERLVNEGVYTPIIRGLYETNKRTPAHLLAGVICAPSYISFEYALAHYGMIPEAVYTVTCATYLKRKRKQFATPFGNYTYCDVPSKVYPLGVRYCEENGYCYLIATPEKALCDQMYKLSPIASQREMEQALFEYLRIDEDVLDTLNLQDIEEIAKVYGSTNVQLLNRYLKRRNRNG